MNQTTIHPNCLGRLNFPLKDVSTEEYPAPWEMVERGNGHFDVCDAQNRIFASVYCWDDNEFDQFSEWVNKQRTNTNDVC